MTEQEWLTSTDPAAMLNYQNGASTFRGQPSINVSRPRPSERKLRLFDDACFSLFRLTIDDVGAGQVNPPVGISALLRDIFGNPWKPVTPIHNRYGDVECADCGGAGELYGNPWADDGMEGCAECGGRGTVKGDIPAEHWLTPTVLAIARQAYDEPGRVCERCKGEKLIDVPDGYVVSHQADCPDCHGTGRVGRVCERCKGEGAYSWHGGGTQVPQKYGTETCPDCHGTGKIEDGTLDPVALSILADAMEEAGCDNEDILMHLRGKEPSSWSDEDGGPYRDWHPLAVPHVRGCHVIDLLLGLE